MTSLRIIPVLCLLLTGCIGTQSDRFLGSWSGTIYININGPAGYEMLMRDKTIEIGRSTEGTLVVFDGTCSYRFEPVSSARAELIPSSCDALDFLEGTATLIDDHRLHIGMRNASDEGMFTGGWSMVLERAQ